MLKNLKYRLACFFLLVKQKTQDEGLGYHVRGQNFAPSFLLLYYFLKIKQSWEIFTAV